MAHLLRPRTSSMSAEVKDTFVSSVWLSCKLEPGEGPMIFGAGLSEIRNLKVQTLVMCRRTIGV